MDEKVKSVRTLKSHPDIKQATQVSNWRNFEVDWSIDGKDKRRVLFVKHLSGIPTVLTKKLKKGFVRQVNIAENNFDFDSTKPAFRSKNTFYYLVDIDKGQLDFVIPPDPASPELRYKILKKGLVSQLVSGLDTKGLTEMILYILLAGAAFGFMGYIIGNVLPIG